jgi:hypothetical protein
MSAAVGSRSVSSGLYQFPEKRELKKSFRKEFEKSFKKEFMGKGSPKSKSRAFRASSIGKVIKLVVNSFAGSQCSNLTLELKTYELVKERGFCVRDVLSDADREFRKRIVGVLMQSALIVPVSPVSSRYRSKTM